MALYPYVGTKENLLALMQDHALAGSPGDGPGTDLAADLLAWATAFFEVHLAHPWLTELSWAQSGQGPNEQDWLERLLAIMDRWAAPDATTVTMLYATVRATAETTAAYRRVDASGWLELAGATARLIPDLRERYPLSTGLAPLDPDWREAPRAALRTAVEILAAALPSRNTRDARRPGPGRTPA